MRSHAATVYHRYGRKASTSRSDSDDGEYLARSKTQTTFFKGSSPLTNNPINDHQVLESLPELPFSSKQSSN